VWAVRCREKIAAPRARHEITGCGRRGDDERKRRIEQGKRCKGHDGDRERDAVAQRAPPDAQNRLHDDRHDGCFQPEEQAFDDRMTSKRHVENAQQQDCEETGQHEKRAGYEPTARAVHEPTYVRCELLCFRAGQ
jgi:hypothetical protein